MSATDILRRHLDEAGVYYEPRGSYTTAIPVGAATWYAQDRYDGTIRLSVAGALLPDEVVAAITGPTAEMGTLIEEDGEWGRSWCCSCGRNVGQHYHFCPWCGARFVDG